MSLPWGPPKRRQKARQVQADALTEGVIFASIGGLMRPQRIYVERTSVRWLVPARTPAPIALKTAPHRESVDLSCGLR